VPIYIIALTLHHNYFDHLRNTEMEFYIFIGLLSMSLALFALPQKLKLPFTLFLNIALALISGIWCFLSLKNGVTYQPGWIFEIDQLSAWFMLIVNLTAITGSLYASGYLKKYLAKRSSTQMALHLFSFVWLHLSMLLVLMLKDGFFFLVSWELMSLSSFVLVIFNANKPTIKTGINYLVQMHIGFLFLLIGFIVTEKGTGIFGFNGLNDYFLHFGNIGLFTLFFIGFGIKAGFIPLHTWLPDAHPAAPSHVSAVMSGVMIKMGIYGIIRTLMYVREDLLWIGYGILAISAITGLLGIMFAIVQRDLKKLLAYSSIENIGIIGIGIGLGIIGLGEKNQFLIYFGFMGSFLHILNHSLFKSLLFYSAGSVYYTQNIELLGGIIKRLPVTSILFLTGALAISGLPPFNGFISEFMIYLGLFKSLYHADLYTAIAIILTVISLTLIGGLAIFCFTKTFGIVFLGEARSELPSQIQKDTFSMLLSKGIAVVFILAVAFMPVFFIRLIENIVFASFSITTIKPISNGFSEGLWRVSLLSAIFVGVAAILLAIRHFRLKKVEITEGETWGCGYTAPTPTLQYTATSYADNFAKLADPVLHAHRDMTPIKEEEIFPAPRNFNEYMNDFIDIQMVRLPASKLAEKIKAISKMQSGQLQHYLLYAFIFLIIIAFLSLLKII
jgi:hydrogenase-4 component B